jgi:hypothetical protein
MVITSNSTTIVSAGTPSVIVLVLLVGFLIAKEITISRTDDRTQVVGRILDVGLLPLLFVAGAVIAAEIVR